VVPETRYTFDKVLGPNSTQADVFEAAVAPVIADVMNGYNGTIMAYGQTGAGKTHTLSSIEPENIGMMPRAAAEVFVQAGSDPAHDYVVLMSYVQIYMELIQDLLRPESENLVRLNQRGHIPSRSPRQGKVAGRVVVRMIMDMAIEVMVRMIRLMAFIMMMITVSDNECGDL
jgi:hypothetical protein